MLPMLSCCVRTEQDRGNSFHLRLPTTDTLNLLVTAIQEVTNVDTLCVAMRKIDPSWCSMGKPEGLIRAIATQDDPGFDGVTHSDFFSSLLLLMARKAEEVRRLTEEECGSTDGIPLLRSGTSKAVELSRNLVSSLLCCAFFGILEEPSLYVDDQKVSCGLNWNEISFAPLLQHSAPQEVAKLQCILKYFQVACSDEGLRGNIVVCRKVSSKFTSEISSWAECSSVLIEPDIVEKGSITYPGNGIHVDFANEYLGGGVLSGGCVQEEIMFAEAPESLACTMLCEAMKENEAVCIAGVEFFARTSGYMFNLRYSRQAARANSYSCGCIPSLVIAIDAQRFGGRTPAAFQCLEGVLLRELVKCFAGFHPCPGGIESWSTSGDIGVETVDCARKGCRQKCLANVLNMSHATHIATGNWGCGVFGGDKEVKALLQWAVSSAVKKPIRYYCFGDNNLTESFHRISRQIMSQKDEKATVGWLIRELLALGEEYTSEHAKATAEARSTREPGQQNHLTIVPISVLSEMTAFSRIYKELSEPYEDGASILAPGSL